MNLIEFLNVLKTNPECNFIAQTVTTLQANSVDATIAYLAEHGIDLNGYVLMIPHGTTGKLVTRDKFTNNNPRIRYIDFEFSDTLSLKDRIIAKVYSLFKNIKKKKSNQSDFYIASPVFNFNWLYLLRKIYPNRNFKFVLLEDGGGSYADHFTNSLDFVKYAYNSNTHCVRYTLAYIRFCILFFYEYINIILIGKKQNLIKTTIFRREVNNNLAKLTKNGDIDKYYQSVFKKMGSKIPIEKLTDFENCVLINTQCLKSNNVTDGVADFDIYSKTVNLLKKYEFSVVLKPHPRELDYKKYNRLGCKLFTDTAYTQESILANLKTKPKCIISIFSSTLLNAYGIFNIPAISLAKIMLHEKINDVFRKQLLDFIDLYKDLFYFPENYKELEEYLNRI